MTYKRWSSFLLLSTFVSVFPLSATQGPEEKYYRAKTVDLGNLVISNAHVHLVAIPRSPKDYDDVQVLAIDRGHVYIRANGATTSKPASHDAIEGDIADGTDSDPAATLRGVFRWEKGKIVECNLVSLHIRLRRATGEIPISEGKIIPGASRIIFVDNKGMINLSGGHDNGFLKVTLPGAEIKEANIVVQKAKFKANLQSRLDDPPELEIDLSSGNITPTNGKFQAAANTKITQPVSMNFFPGEEVSSSTLALTNLSVELRDGKAHLKIADVSLENPAIKVKGHEDLPIVATESYLAHDVSSDSPGAQFTFTEIHSSKAYAKPDRWELANRLNGAGVFAQEVLLPVANSDIHYVKLSDLMNLYKILGINDDSKTTITRVVIQQDSGVITKISVDTLPAKPPANNVQIEHPVCVFIGTVSGVSAGIAVDALLAEVPIAAGATAWLRVTSPVNPWIAGPSFFGTFAVSSGAVRLVGKGFTGFDGLAVAAGYHLTSDYCEVLIAHMPNHYSIGTPDYTYHPIVFEGISVTPDRLFEDELSMRYQLYLGQAVKTSALRHDPLYRELNNKMSATTALLKTVRENASQIRDVNEAKQAEYAQQWTAAEVARKAETDKYELGNLAASATVKYVGDQKRAYEEQQREAQKRVTPGPSGQPQVPGTPPAQPPPPGYGGGKSSSNTDGCGGSPNCIHVTAHPGGGPN
jgi:hypothetical protein